MNEHMDVTLMIADDESFILRGLKEIVSDSDLPLKLIGTAGNGMDAFALLLSSSPDIAIMDIRMPGMDGLEVIRRARDAGLTTHFLILSGYNDFSYAQEAIRYNVHGYFLKPLNIQAGTFRRIPGCPCHTRKICIRYNQHGRTEQPDGIFAFLFSCTASAG